MTYTWAQILILGLSVTIFVSGRSVPLQDKKLVHHIEKRMIHKRYAGHYGPFNSKQHCLFMKGPFATASARGCAGQLINFLRPFMTTQAPTTTTVPITTTQSPQTTTKPYFHYTKKPYYHRPRPQSYHEYHYEETDDEYDSKSEDMGEDWGDRDENGHSND